jgi:Protein of unknown function (DUF3761)
LFRKTSRRSNAAVLFATIAAALSVATGATAYAPNHVQLAQAVHVQPAAGSSSSCKSGYYKNVSGHCIHSPSSSANGATARCRDGSYSYSEHASGTCSHHGGVSRWIHHP